LTGKPPFLKDSWNRRQGKKYGYDNPESLKDHIRTYWASVTEMDAAIGNLLETVRKANVQTTTHIIFMGDNGWLLGEHGLSSKMVSYEESMRVPLIITGPGIRQGKCNELALNIDLAPTMLELAGLPKDNNMHGRSLVPLLRGEDTDWRKTFVYELPKPHLGTPSQWAVRSEKWKYIVTRISDEERFEELYDLQEDPYEMNNLVIPEGVKQYASQIQVLRHVLQKWQNDSPKRGKPM
jgi:arylsulfatase A-like enzyme